MSLIDEAKAETRKGPPCGVGVLIASDPDGFGAEVVEALDDLDCTAAALSRALAKHGHRVAPDTIRRHRRGDCLCG